MTIWDRSGVKRSDFDPALFASLDGAARVPEDFAGNGCSFIPDDLPGMVDKCPACHVHDFDYHVGGGWPEFRDANRRLYRNLRTLGIPRWDATAVFVGVVVAGAPHFHWDATSPSVARMNASIQFAEAVAHKKDLSWREVAAAAWSVPIIRNRVLAIVLAVLTFVATSLGVALPASAWVDRERSAPPVVALPFPYQSGSGSTGSASTVEQSVTLGVSSGLYTQVVVGQTWVAADSEIICGVLGTTADSQTPETIAIGGLSVTTSDRVVGTGFTINVFSPYGLSGAVRVHCTGA